MTGRTLKILLAVSIAVNLFLLGALGGGAATWLKTTPRRPILRAAQGLPPTDRNRFQQVLQAVVKDSRPIQRQARDDRHVAAQLFVQPSFDVAEVNAALSRARDADVAVRTRLETSMVAFAATLPQPERAAMADGLSKGGPLRQPKWRKDRKDMF
ncbi:MAG: periplasmic heavy metal sensor [Caulobacteraceae bacterium]